MTFIWISIKLVDRFYVNCTLGKIIKGLAKDNIKQLRVKNGKIKRLCPRADHSYSVRLVNLASYPIYI